MCVCVFVRVCFRIARAVVLSVDASRVPVHRRTEGFSLTAPPAWTATAWPAMDPLRELHLRLAVEMAAGSHNTSPEAYRVRTEEGRLLHKVE